MLDVTRSALAVLAAMLLLAAPAASAAPARTTLSDVENEVMCTVCGVPLNLAQDAPEANRERAFIQRLIDRGETKSQIKQAMREQFGPSVLALPPAHGFSLAAYLVPIGLFAAAVIALVLTLPRWRRRARRRGAAGATAGDGLGAADARRLDEDLARYDT